MTRAEWINRGSDWTVPGIISTTTGNLFYANRMELNLKVMEAHSTNIIPRFCYRASTSLISHSSSWRTLKSERKNFDIDFSVKLNRYPKKILFHFLWINNSN